MVEQATTQYAVGKTRRLHGGKVHTGIRGGQYMNKHGRRVYLGNQAYQSKKVKQAEAPAKYRL